MQATRLVSVIGLAFGDCGKGLFVDYLCRRWRAHTVVRFNGGGQAGHNVVLPDGRRHTFSQFGAATFVPGVATVLAEPVVIHPGALLVEHDYLRRCGVDDAMARLLIDPRCRVTTPFHQACGRLRELARGALAHGSCGVGVGATVLHSLQHPAQTIMYADLARPALALEKAEAIRRTLFDACADLAAAGPQASSARAWQNEWRVLADCSAAARWLAQIAELARRVPPAAAGAIGARLAAPGTVLFEGAQGVLLDQWRGFHPHTSWSSTVPAAAEAVARDAGQDGAFEHLAVLRTYLTRHGAGPLPTHDARLDLLTEAHNGDAGWQGAFRRGHPDVLLLRYALAVAGPFDGLLVSHLDVFQRERALRWCRAYEIDGAEVGALVAGAGGDLAHQAALTDLLARARPCYAGPAIGSASAFNEALETLAQLPVRFGARGPTHADVIALGGAGAAR